MPDAIPQDENQIIAERRAKLAALRAGGQAFPNDFRRDALAGDLHAKHGGESNEALESLAIPVNVAGRMMLKRVMGKACFATLQDMSGRIQLYVTIDGVGADALESFKHWDLGDIVAATGTLFKTRTGELSVKATSVRLLTKSLRPLPEKFHGMTDTEQRYRQRYVDLITNPQARDVFVKRSQIVQAIREFFVARGYLEVETPMMHPIPGGAAARPFSTHHNALDMELFLRIAPELYLKKLVVGGMEKVFDLGWVASFRSRTNPSLQVSLVSGDAGAPEDSALSVHVDDVDASFEAEMEPALAKAEKQYESFELRALMSGKHDSCSAVVSIKPGASFFDSVTSFEMARGGRLSAVILGAYQVDQHGNLANFSVVDARLGGIGGAGCPSGAREAWCRRGRSQPHALSYRHPSG